SQARWRSFSSAASLSQLDTVDPSLSALDFNAEYRSGSMEMVTFRTVTATSIPRYDRLRSLLDRLPGELGEGSVPRQAQRELGVGEQASQHVPYARLAAERQAVGVRAGQQHRLGAQRDRLDHVRAGPDA